MKFKKIYVEITNVCNFNCGFCFKTGRAGRFMTVEEFELAVKKIRPFTDYVFLHVLGEPLLHPELDGILTVAESAGLKINIDTNGALLDANKELFRNHLVRQLVVSLHDAQENIAPENWEAYLQTALDVAAEIAPRTYVCLRLWNISSASSAGFNSLCFEKIAGKFELRLDKAIEATSGNGTRLAEHVFLQLKARFEWPGQDKPHKQTEKKCYALRDHIAVLVDGRVVPCCLDADANMELGNIFSDDLSQMIESERAKKIRKGFQQHKIVEPICATCGFIVD